jgi:hypothetical protein
MAPSERTSRPLPSQHPPAWKGTQVGCVRAASHRIASRLIHAQSRYTRLWIMRRGTGLVASCEAAGHTAWATLSGSIPLACASLQAPFARTNDLIPNLPIAFSLLSFQSSPYLPQTPAHKSRVSLVVTALPPTARACKTRCLPSVATRDPHHPYVS